MKVLWLCNVALPLAAGAFGMEASNKEGWVSGLMDTVLKHQAENAVQLAIAFPVSADVLPEGAEVCRRTARADGVSVDCFGFLENVRRAAVYEPALEERMRKITDEAQPDIVHCFGTEYPHTLAMCRSFPHRERLLVSLQGLCTFIAQAYYADLPERVIRSVTLRDLLRRDSLVQQRENFALRGHMERETVLRAGNVAGRTEWDRECVRQWNPGIRYFHMNETLRPEFYGPVWRAENCIPHSIFVSQGDYPLKGLHYMLCAMPRILEKYPDTRLYVAGDSLAECRTLKQRLKMPAYGRYLRGLIKENGLEDKVVFLGRLSAGQMRDRYLKSNLFVCCSALENSPNSLGEAMLLGMPCVSADVGGIPSLFTGGKDGIMYEGHRLEAEISPEPEPGTKSGNIAKPGRRKNEINNARENSKKRMIFISNALSDAVLEIWRDTERMKIFCENARKHAENTHKKEENYHVMMGIYADINSGNFAE